MNILSLLAFFAFIVYMYFSVYIYRLDPASKLNRTFSFLCLTYGIWAFAYTFFYSAPNKEVAWYWYKVSVASWSFFPGIALHFFLILTEKEGLLRKWWVYPILYIPGLVFSYKALSDVLLVKDFVYQGLGWCEVAPPGSAWLWAYPAYYTSFVLTGLLLTLRWGNRSKILRKRKQAKMIVFTAFPVLITTAVTDSLLPAMDIQVIPSIASILILTWIFGIWYSIVKYKFMILTPSIAADEIISKMVDLLVLVNPEGNIIKVNRHTNEILGYDEGEVIGKPLSAIVMGEDRIRGEFSKMGRDSCHTYTAELNYRTKRGEEIPINISCSAIKDREGDVIGVVIVGQDLRQMKQLRMEIAERKRAEATLLAAEAKFRSLVEQSLVGIYITQDRRLMYVNPKFALIFGYTREELISSKSFSDVVAEDSREEVENNIQGCLLGELSSIRSAFRGRRRDGVLIDVEAHGTKTELEGRPAIIGTLIDITERKQMEEELIRAQKLESIGVLAGGIAHDFNNLLTGILGNISLAKMLIKQEDKACERLEEAEKASERARDLTQQLLTFSKGGRPLKKTVSIGPIVMDSASFALRGSNARCEFSVTDDIWPVDVDEG